MTPGIWLRAARAPFFTASVVPVTLGSALAWHETGVLEWPRAVLAALGIVLLHAGANLTNEYTDHETGADAADSVRTRYSGGSGVIQEGLVTPRGILAGALATLAVGVGIGLYLNHAVAGNIILTLGAAGVLLGFSYSARPLMLGYRGFGLGELSVGISFGPLPVLGSYYVQTQELSHGVLLVSLPIAVLIALVLIINGIPDRESDRAVGKRTLAVVLGERGTLAVYRALLAAAYALVAVSVATGAAPPACLVALASAPLAWRAVVVSTRHVDDPDKLVPANAATVGLHAATGLLLVLGLVLDRVL